MKTEWVKKNLTIEDIEIRRKQFADDAQVITGHYPGNFDPDIFDEMMKESAAGETIDLMKELTKSYMDKYKEDAELCIICDMAIEYLKIREKELEGQKSEPAVYTEYQHDNSYRKRLKEQINKGMDINSLHPNERIIEFLSEKIEPGEAYITCKICNGRGSVQIAPNTRGIKLCDCCNGKGTVRVK